MKYISLLICFFYSFLCAFSQTEDINLGNEYYNQGDYEKAIVYYKKAFTKDESNTNVYYNYTDCLIKLLLFEEAEKVIKKVVKKNEQNPGFLVDLGVLYKKWNKQKEAKEVFQSIIDKIEGNLNYARSAGSSFYRQDELNLAAQVYLRYRKNVNNVNIFSTELIQIFRKLGDINAMIEELLTMAIFNPGLTDYVKNQLQNTLKEENEFTKLESVLYQKILKFPDEVIFSELLMWLYFQKKDFENALLQAKAIDKRVPGNNSRVMEVGYISLENHDFPTAIHAFEYEVQKGENKFFYIQARGFLIHAKEEFIKAGVFVDSINKHTILNDYKNFLYDLGENTATAPFIRNMALHYAFYMNELDSAILVFEKLIKMSGLAKNLIQQCKLDLGDIYILKDEKWESTLLYSQVEKSCKEEPLGHQAKLRNARLSYFYGDFEWAQAQLNILKNATSREIANDALSLSLFIKDNLSLDTVADPILSYSKAELLLFQNKFKPALDTLNTILIKYPGHTLSDDIFFMKSKIFLKIGFIDSSLFCLQIILQKFPKDILADDALFKMAEINEINLKNKDKAKELYYALLTKYPGSLYKVEARKRFRKLRGDGI